MKYISIFVLLFLTSCFERVDKRNGTFGFADHINKICGIELPKSTKIIYESDNGEGRGEALYSIEKTDIKTFVKQNSFLPIDSLISPFTTDILKEDSKEILARYDFKMNSDEKYRLKYYPNLLYTEKCKKKNLFMLMIDTSKALLWFNLSYPDMAGDGPNCE